MQIKNTDSRYGIITILLHWLMAVLLLTLMGIGLYMVGLPISYEKLKLYGWHKEYGLLALALVVLRLGWRMLNVTPHLALPWLEKFAARSVHWAFYGFMFALPLSGWMLTSAAGLPVSFFGLFVLPDLVTANAGLRDQLTVIHQWLGYGLILTIALHASAALKHHFINRDDILRRMLR